MMTNCFTVVRSEFSLKYAASTGFYVVERLFVDTNINAKSAGNGTPTQRCQEWLIYHLHDYDCTSLPSTLLEWIALVLLP